MKSPVMKLAALFALLGVAFGGAGCAGSETAAVPSQDDVAVAGAGEVEAPAEVVIVDVRTPEEYQAGHLDGATNLDLNSGQFAQSIPDLDPEQTYWIYCRSGNRSGQATQMLQEAGFQNVEDLGSLEEAAGATGVDVVQ